MEARLGGGEAESFGAGNRRDWDISSFHYLKVVTFVKYLSKVPT